jgi:hypothetical protein
MNYYILNSKKQLMFTVPIDLPQPVQTIFCKDRKTKQRYLMFRTVTQNALTAPKILIPVMFSQYDGIIVATE